MRSPSERSKTLPAPALQQWLETAFGLAGMTADEARITSTVLTQADLRGVYSHGSVRVAQYVDLVERRRWQSGAEPEVLVESGSVVLWDGHHGVGPYLAMAAMRRAMALARESGIAWVWLRNAGHFGTAEAYTIEAARAGMIGLAFTNSSPAMAAWGGTRPVIGANPWSVALPCQPSEWPVVLDIANTAAARGRVRAAAASDTQLPKGWGVDAEGASTQNPTAVLNGSLLPFGGHKGYGIAFMVEALTAAVSGAALSVEVKGPDEESDGHQLVGQAFGAIDASRIISLEELSSRLDHLAGLMRASGVDDPSSGVLVPGEREARLAEAQGREGISLPSVSRRSIGVVAQRLGIAGPPGLRLR
jgi:LDH2 family malate/lactate/ureidoglycolate dehydrogenase